MTELDLVAADSAAIEAMIAGQVPGLQLPKGGLGLSDVLAALRASADIWMMVQDAVIVGLCGFIDEPANRRPEIGYGVAPAFRGHGLARSAVGLLQREARTRGLAGLTAHSAAANPASGRVLKSAGFLETARAEDPDRGVVIGWEWRV